MQYGSGIQETYLSICFLRWVANRSTCGLNWNLSHKILNNFWESTHSVLSLKTLDILSVIVFSAPGMWLEKILCKFPYTFRNIIINNRMHASHIANVFQSSAIIS